MSIPFALNAKGLDNPTRDKQSLEQLWSPLVSKGVLPEDDTWQKVLEQSRLIMLEIGMKSHRALGDAVARRAIVFLEEGSLHKAELCVGAINTLDPQSLFAGELKARIALKRSKMAVAKWFAAKGAKYSKELGTQSGKLTVIKTTAAFALLFACVFYLVLVLDKFSSMD